MAGILSELRRRNVFRVAAAYLVVGWIIIQLAALLESSLGLPAWFDAAAIGFLVLGFPIALLLAWAFEMTPDGMRKTEPSDDPQGFRPLGRTDYAIIGLLVVVLGATGYQLATRQNAPASASETAGTTTGPETTVAGTSSIAVLPFVDMSDTADQAYFSDGMTEEIINALVRIPDLAVAARTSVFAFRDTDEDIRSIGTQLGVNHVLEGSVRSADGQLRITAQLINVETGFHLWSETYDRPRENIFAVQEEIATAIAARLTEGFGGQNLVPNRTTDIDAYDHYLRGAAALRVRHLSEALPALQQAIDADPDFAPAWAALAIVQEIYNNLDAAEAAAHRALALDAENVDALTALASVHRDRFDWLEAEQVYRQAYAIDPESSELAEDYAEFLNFVGYARRAREIARRGNELDRYMMPLARMYVETLMVTGELNEALTVLDRHDSEDVIMAISYLQTRYLQDGLPGLMETLEQFRAISQFQAQNSEVEDDRAGWQYAAARLDSIIAAVGPQRDAGAIEDVRASIVNGDPNFPISITYLAGIELGMDQEILDSWQPQDAAGYARPWSYFWHRPFARLRPDGKFRQIVESMGLPDYWRIAGWPDYCRPLAGNDFECFDPTAE